jgi:hypothetical protein
MYRARPKTLIAIVKARDTEGAKTLKDRDPFLYRRAASGAANVPMATTRVVNGEINVREADT